jgi:hypothetical protein
MLSLEAEISSNNKYIRIPSLPQREHFLITKVIWSNVFKEIIPEETEDHAKRIIIKISLT